MKNEQSFSIKRPVEQKGRLCFLPQPCTKRDTYVQTIACTIYGSIKMTITSWKKLNFSQSTLFVLGKARTDPKICFIFNI